MDNAPICFDDWEHALRTSVPADRHHAYREAIVKFRRKHPARSNRTTNYFRFLL